MIEDACRMINFEFFNKYFMPISFSVRQDKKNHSGQLSSKQVDLRKESKVQQCKNDHRFLFPRGRVWSRVDSKLILGSGRGRITREVDINLVLICSVNVTVDCKTAGFF